MQKVLQNFICRTKFHLSSFNGTITEQLNTVTHSSIGEESLTWNISLKQLLTAN